jgi:hypothetical protein
LATHGEATERWRMAVYSDLTRRIRALRLNRHFPGERVADHRRGEVGSAGAHARLGRGGTWLRDDPATVAWAAYREEIGSGIPVPSAASGRRGGAGTNSERTPMARWRVSIEFETGTTKRDAQERARALLDELTPTGAIAAYLRAVRPPKGAYPLQRPPHARAAKSPRERTR